MGRIQRPLDRDAVVMADEQIYAAHANDRRTNPLFDSNGDRLRLDPVAPDQVAPRREWCKLYEAELASHKQDVAAGAGPSQPPTPTPTESDSPSVTREGT